MGEKVRPEVASRFLVEGLRTLVRFYDLLALRLRARQIVSPDLVGRDLSTLSHFKTNCLLESLTIVLMNNGQTLNLYYR